MTDAEMDSMTAELKRFARKEAEPGVLAADDKRDAGWIAGLWKKSLSLDLPLLTVPEKFNGAGGDDLCAAQAVNTLGECCAALASAFAFHFAACRAISALGDESVIKGRIFSEASNTNDPAILTLAPPDPSCGQFFKIIRKNGAAAISGSCPAVGNAAFAHYFLFFAKDEGGAENLVLVPRGIRGLSMGPDPLFPGLCANPLLPVSLDGVSLGVSASENALCDNEGMLLESGLLAEKILEAAQNAFFGFTAAIAVGLSNAAFNAAYKYAQSRYQFGKIIVFHSEIQRMLGKMLQTINVGTAVWQKVFSGSTASRQNVSDDLGLFAKTWCADAALSATSDCVQIFGGYGVMHEYGMEKRMRDAKMLQLLGGPTPWLLIESIRDRLSGRFQADKEEK